MKTSDLKKKLKESAINEMPDILNKINLDSIDIIPEEETNKTTLWNLRRVMTYTFTFLFLGVISLTAYTLFNQETTTVLPLQTEESLISFQAISSATLLDEIEVIPLSYDLLGEDGSSSIASELTTVNEYLNMMEVVLGDADTMVSVSVESDDPLYEHYILYRNVDLIGNLIEFKIYYNITENADSTILSGVMYHDDRTYTIGGFVDMENGALTSFSTYLDDNNYVMVSDISDDTTQKFAYYQYSSNEILNQGIVSVQLSNSVMKASIDTTGNSASLSMSVSRVRVAEATRLQVRYQMNQSGITSDGEFEVGVEFNQTSGMYQYMYYMMISGSQAEFSCGRGYKGNQPATDDDFTVTGSSTTPITGHGNGMNGNGHGNFTSTITSTSDLLITDTNIESYSI